MEQEVDGGSYQFRQDGSLDGKIPTRKNTHPTVKPTEPKPVITVKANKTSLKAGQTAKVYVVVEPATCAGSQVTFQVNDTFEKKITVDEVTFTAGKIKKVNFSLE